MDNNTNGLLGNTGSDQQPLQEYTQQQTQIADVEETAVDNNSPCEEVGETLVNPNSTLHAIPLPFIETRCPPEHDFAPEEVAPNSNEDEPPFIGDVSKEKVFEVFSTPVEDADKTTMQPVDERQEEEKNSTFPEDSQEKLTNVELQDLDYWELEDDGNFEGSYERKHLVSNESTQQAKSENDFEAENSQPSLFPDTEAVVVDSDTKPEEMEQIFQKEEQEKEETTGKENLIDVKDLHEATQQEYEPLSPREVSSETKLPVITTASAAVEKEDHDSLGTRQADGSDITQEANTLHSSDSYSYTTGQSPEQSVYSSLMNNEQKGIVGSTETNETHMNTSEWEDASDKNTEKEQQSQETVEKLQNSANNESSSIEVDVKKEGPSFNSQDETSQTEFRVSSLRESKPIDTFESRARLHMLGDSQYKEKGWGHVKLQKQANHAASKLTFSVEPATNIFESKIDTDTKFQRVRAKSVRISGSKEQGKDDFVLQLPDTQVAEEFVEFLTVAINEQTKRESSSSVTDKDVLGSRAQSLDNQILAQKQMEMERVRQHIAELEMRKALVRRSLQKKAKESSQNSSPVTSTIPESPAISSLDTANVSNVISNPETTLLSNETVEISLPKEVVAVQGTTDKEFAQDMLEPGYQKISEEHKQDENNSTIAQEQNAMELEMPMSQHEYMQSAQEQSTKYSSSEQDSNQNNNQTVVATEEDRKMYQHPEEFSDIVEQVRKLERYVQEQFQYTKSSLSDCLKREELDLNLNKLMKLLFSETESRISLLLSEMDGIVRLLDKSREDNQSEAFTCCRPWSFSDFLTRLHTFRPTTWPAKPESIDAVECARRGWRNAGFNLLECEGKFVYFDENATDYSEQVDMVRKKITGRGYRFMSPWIGNPCPESFRQVPWSIVSQTIERSRELRDLELSISLEKSCIDSLQEELEMFSKPKLEDVLQFFALDDERKRDSFLLGIFGWTMEPLMKQSIAGCYETCLHCEYCDIRIISDFSTDIKFHAEREHRSFCAFRRGGWKSCLEYIRQFLLSGNQGKMDTVNDSISGVKRLREDDEEIRADSNGTTNIELTT